MNILVISRSNVVKELIKLILEKENFNTDYVNSSKEVASGIYDTIFLDDSVYNLDMELEFIKNIEYSKLIFIGTNRHIKTKVDEVIKKPFLPKDIKNALENLPLKISSVHVKTNEIKTKILDPQEIARIKELIQDDEDEHKQELSYIDLLTDRQSLKLKKKKAKELLYEISTLSKKDIKRLLKGAKISIKIQFKSDNYE